MTVRTITGGGPEWRGAFAAGSPWRQELRQTLRLAWPLIAAQLAQMAINTTDVVMMGWLGSGSLAAGALTMSVVHPLLLLGIGMISAVAALVAQARGARDIKGVRRSVRQGLWVAAILSVVLVPAIMQTGAVLAWTGQDPAVSDLADSYAKAVAWMVPPALVLMVLRAFTSAYGLTSVVLWVTLAGVVANGVANYGLMFGHWGLPRLELAGAGIATVIVDILMAGLLYAYVHRHRRLRRYHILVRLWRPDWPRFRDLVRIGWPVGLMLLAETGLFAVASVMMGRIGTEQLAGHAVALQCAALAFMVPLGLSQATTIRVGLAYGAGLPEGIRLAGWASMAAGTVFMTGTSFLFLFFPGPLVQAFLDGGDPSNVLALGFAAQFLVMAALFQLVDGAQVISAAALRGLSDTRVPMIVGLVGYWLVGLPIGYMVGFPLGFGGIGIWIGLAVGLAFVAMVLTLRFAARERFGLVAASPFTSTKLRRINP